MTETCNRCGRQLVAAYEIEVGTCNRCDEALFDALTASPQEEPAAPDWSEDFDVGGEA